MTIAALVLAGLGIIATAFLALLFHKKTSKLLRLMTELLKRLDKKLLKVLDYFEPQFDTVESPKVQTLTPKPVEAKTGVGKARVEVGEPKDVTIKVPLATAELEGLPPHVEIKGQTKEEAQKRLDEDTRNAGHLRGELYELKDGGWGIHWGGKYPLNPGGTGTK